MPKQHHQSSIELNAVNGSSQRRRMMPFRSAAAESTSKSTSCFSPARRGGKTGTAACWGSMVMSGACWGWLSMHIWEARVHVWQLSAISAGSPWQGGLVAQSKTFALLRVEVVQVIALPRRSASPLPARSTTTPHSGRAGGGQNGRLCEAGK